MELYEALEQRQVKYVIRLPANDNLERKVVQLLTRPVGRPRHKPLVTACLGIGKGPRRAQHKGLSPALTGIFVNRPKPSGKSFFFSSKING